MTHTKVDFLGIGVQRGASTWLWSSLGKHPDIWLPPVKELHYFDRLPKYHSHSHFASENFWVRLFGQQAHDQVFRRVFKKQLTQMMPKILLKGDINSLKWFARYLFGNIDDTWYCSLFEQGEGQVKGDITPAYSILSVNDIQHVKALFPDIKIILILRNPVERAWSYVCYRTQQERFHGIDDLSKIKQIVNGPIQTLRGNYLSILKNWESIFPKEQIYIGFYEDVVRAPEALMSSIFDFLEVDKGTYKHYTSLTKRINSSDKIQQVIPPEIEYLLAKKYRYQIKELSKRFGGHAENWRKENASILKRYKQADIPSVN